MLCEILGASWKSLMGCTVWMLIDLLAPVMLRCHGEVLWVTRVVNFVTRRWRSGRSVHQRGSLSPLNHPWLQVGQFVYDVTIRDCYLKPKSFPLDSLK